MKTGKVITIQVLLVVLALTKSLPAFSQSFGAAGTAASSNNPSTSTNSGSNQYTYSNQQNYNVNDAAAAGYDTSNKQKDAAVATAGAAVMYGGMCAASWGFSMSCVYTGLAAAAGTALMNAAHGSAAAGGSMAGFDPNSINYQIPDYSNLANNNSGGGQPVIDPVNWSTSSSHNSGATMNGTVGGVAAQNPGVSITADGAIAIQNGSSVSAQDVLRTGNAIALASLEKAGVKISPDGKTMTFKNGKTVDLTKAGAKGGMDGLGFSKEDMDKTMAASQKYASSTALHNAALAQGLSRMPAGMSGGGGGGGSLSAGGGDGGGGALGANAYRMPKLGEPRAKPKLSGLTKKHGEDSIGVSADNIFEMVTRRYMSRDKDGNFLKD